MNIEEIRSYRNAKPFEPFDIVLDDGKTVHVSVKERMALSPTGDMAFVFEGSRLSFVEISRVTALNHRKFIPPWKRPES